MNTLLSLLELENSLDASNLEIQYYHDDVPRLDENIWRSMDQALVGVYFRENKMVNYRSFNFPKIRVGPLYFSQYDAKRRVMDNPSLYNLSQEELLSLTKEIRALSLFPACHDKDGNLIMAVKRTGIIEPGKLRYSFPGAGPIDQVKSFGSKETRILSDLFADNIYNQLGWAPLEYTRQSVLGIYEDASVGSYRRPDVFCKVDSKMSTREVKESYASSPKHDKHVSMLIVPTNDQSLYDAFLDSDKMNGGSCTDLPRRYVSEIDGIGEARKINTTHKAHYMLRLLGRVYFGNGWYEDRMRRDSRCLKVLKA